MTAPSDEKAIEAAHIAYERYGQAGDLKTQRLPSGCIEAIVRAYLAASPSPSEMEVVEGLLSDGQPLVTLSQAQSALAAMRAKRDAINTKRRELLDRCWRLSNRAEAAEAQVLRLTEENEALRKDLAAQIAGHQETARQSTDNLVKANAANARIKEAEDRAAKNWRDFRDLRLEIIGHGPMCRDCADFDGRCQGNGPPCDPDEAAKEKLTEWKSAEAHIKALEEAGSQLSNVVFNLAQLSSPLTDDQKASMRKQVAAWDAAQKEQADG